MKNALPSLQNPFADFVVSQVASNVYLADQMREASWDDDDKALAILFLPEVPEDVDFLKEAIVTRFREMAEEAEEDEDFDPDFHFEVAAQQILVNKKPVLMVKVYNREPSSIQAAGG